MPRTLIDTPAALAVAWARDLEARLRAAPGRFSLALPGGSAAETLLPALARADVDWGRLDLFFGDERAVPPDHPDSNFGLARRVLGARLSDAHRLRGEAVDLAAEAARAEADLVATLGAQAALDQVLLGVGPDGHVCSLFAGHSALAENQRLLSVIEDSPKPPPRRLTLTLPALRRARLVVIAAFGAAKADAIGAAVGDPASASPVALVLRQAPDAWLLLDPPASAQLS